MSLFGRKGPTKEELEREDYVKRNVTAEVSRSLKRLQQQYVSSEEPIYSEDSANAVCSCVEAAFLHGLKSSLSTKLTNYLVGTQSDSVPELNFWPLLCKFTHSDVVSQLNHLSQITSEVGMCRAWIRIAINDGLIDSYLDALMQDTETLKSHYRRTAYLRDLEHPGILMRYLQGLSNFNFQLAYNSSVLNNWTTTPLILAGLWTVQSTPAAVRLDTPVVAAEPAYATAVLTKSSSTTKPNKSKHRYGRGRKSDTSGNKQKRELVHSPGAPDTPPNTPYDGPVFTSTTVDEIRHLTSQYLDSASSSSPQTSCPDPTDSRITKPCPVERSSDREDASEQPYERISHDSSESLVVNSDSGAVGGTNESNDANATLSSRCGQDVVQRDKRKGRREQMAVSPEGTRPVFIPRIAQAAEPMSSPAIAATAMQITPDGATKETRIITSVEKEIQDGEDTVFMRTEERSEEGKSQDSDSITSDEDNGLSHQNPEKRHSVGNSLSGMQGWSSEFHADSALVGSGVDIGAVDPMNTSQVGESFNHLLQNYTPEVNDLPTTSIDKVLSELSDPAEEEMKSNKASSYQEEPVLPKEVTQEYEVLSYNTSVLSGKADMRVQALVAVIGQICNEKGLDAQNYLCKGCSRPIGMIYGKARVCTYDGCYYCYECHENDEYFIPSRIIHNWDFRKHKVAKHTMNFIKQVEDDPLIHVDQCNPTIYDHISEMNEIRTLRTELCSLKTYLYTCKQSTADDLRRRMWPKEYLFDDKHLFSLTDLLQVTNGLLAQTLRKLIKYAAKHVYECRLCSQKGFICELCNSPKVIYPFESDTTYRCDLCRAVYHKDCKTDVKPCPKCERLKQRHMQYGQGLPKIESIDYAYNPDET